MSKTKSQIIFQARPLPTTIGSDMPSALGLVLLFSVSKLSKTKSKIKTTAPEETQVAWGRSVATTICLSHLFPNILSNRLNKPRQNIGEQSIWLKTSIDIKWKGTLSLLPTIIALQVGNTPYKTTTFILGGRKGLVLRLKYLFLLCCPFSPIPGIVRFFSSC